MTNCEHKTLVLRRSSNSVSARCAKCWSRIFAGADHVLVWQRGVRERGNNIIHEVRCSQSASGSNVVVNLQRSGDDVIGKCNGCGSIMVKEFAVHVEKDSIIYPQVEQTVITWKLA